MKLKHNYNGKRNDISQPSYINYCFGKCYYFLNKLKKRPVVGGSINKGLFNRILKYISLFYDNDVKVIRFSKKRLFYRKKQKG